MLLSQRFALKLSFGPTSTKTKRPAHLIADDKCRLKLQSALSMRLLFQQNSQDVSKDWKQIKEAPCPTVTGI